MSFIYTLFAYFFVYNFRKKLVYIQERVKMEDSLDVMKKGYFVSMCIGIVGFPIICY